MECGVYRSFATGWQPSIFQLLSLFLLPVKILFFIIAIYLLGLSFIPCGDKEECNSVTEQAVSAPSNHQEHKHDAEACTPFCICSCCAASAFYSTFPKAQVNKEGFQSDKYPIYTVAFTSEAHNIIWQPPKLS